MFKVKNSIIIDKNHKYLSFPDIIQSIKEKSRYFLVYREGDSHHPILSKLIFKKSEDYGRTWETQQEFILSISENGMVWNCPRLSYIGRKLYIICDAKSGTNERISQFKVVFLTSASEGNYFDSRITPLPGMVPDKIIEFKNKFYCANHKIKSRRNDLIQLVSWSTDGELWYNTNIMANNKERQFCEASIVNIDDDYLIAYLRDNSGHRKNIYTVTSTDGINWTYPKKLHIFGQRVTAIKNKDNVIGAYRDTDNCTISLFNHDLEQDRITKADIDWEYTDNQYNFGYTGLAETENEYLLTYYIQQDAKNPYIKLAFVEKE